MPTIPPASTRRCLTTSPPSRSRSRAGGWHCTGRSSTSDWMRTTTPTPAFAIGAKTSDPITMYLNDIYTIGANLAGLPAVSIPCGFVQGLPVGLQIVGPHFSEARVLSAAHAFQRVTDWHTRVPPGYA